MKSVKLGEIGKIITGCTPSTKKSEYYADNKYMFVGPSDIKKVMYVVSSEKNISEKAFEDYKNRFIEENSIVVDCIGSDMGNVAIVKCRCLTNQQINAITNIDEECYNIKYIYYVLSTMKKYFHLIGTNGSTMPILNKTMFENIEVEIPKIEIQNKISKILSKLDDKIKLNNEINNNLHDLAEQQFNGIYLKGSPKKLGELLVSISTGSRPKGGAQDCGVPSIGAEKIEKFGVYNYSSEKYISEEYYEKLKNGKLNSGDVLLYKDGAYTGKVSMCLNDFPHKKAAVNEHVFILNTKNNWAQNYLYFALYNKDNKEMIHRLACSKAAQPGLNQIELKSVEVNICAEKEIINFENSVKPIMKKISSNALENKKLVELRDTLLPKLMNGEIDLDNIEI